jgi:hypothetical protein
LARRVFFDGFAGVEPGCTYIQYLGHDTFNTIDGPNGSKAFDAKLDVNYALPQFSCNSRYTLFGGTLGLDANVPVPGSPRISSRPTAPGWAIF